MQKVNIDRVTSKAPKTESKQVKTAKKIKVSLDQMEPMQVSELLASRVTCQRRS